MKRFLTDSYRQGIDKKICRLVDTHRSSRSPTRPATTCQITRTIQPEILYQATGFTENLAISIYRSKCISREINENPTAEKKFVEKFFSSIKQKSLLFSYRGLGPSGMARLISPILSNPQYLYLDLSMNNLGNKGANHLAHLMEKDPPIIHLDVRSNGIGVEGSCNLMTSLIKNTHLVEIDYSAIDGIERNRLGAQGLEVVSRLLMTNRVLSKFNFSMAGVNESSISSISSALSLNVCLTHLDLSFNRFGSNAGIQLLSTANCLNNIETLILAGNELNDSIAPFLCERISESRSLLTLDLSDNFLSKTTLKQLFGALLGMNKDEGSLDSPEDFSYDMLSSRREKYTTSIQNINLSKNKLGSDCGDLLHLIIRDIYPLKKLSLAKNNLGEEAVAQIGYALAKNTELFSLDLSETNAGNKGAASFEEAISIHPTLTRFDLSSNGIGDEGAIPLAKALASNQVLTYFCLRSNEMNDASATAFLETLQKNHTITDLLVDYNDFGYRSHVQLTQAISDHKRKVNNNIADLANREISMLKKDEEKLIETKEKLQQQHEEVEANLQLRDQKIKELENLKNERTKALKESEEKLIELKKQYEEVSEIRRTQIMRYNNQKTESEAEKNRAASELQQISLKRQQAAQRVSRAVSKALEIRTETNKELDDLRLHLDTIKEQLKSLLINVQIKQEKAREEEEARKAEELAKVKAAELLRRAEIHEKTNSKKKGKNSPKSKQFSPSQINVNQQFDKKNEKKVIRLSTKSSPKKMKPVNVIDYQLQKD